MHHQSAAMPLGIVVGVMRDVAVDDPLAGLERCQDHVVTLARTDVNAVGCEAGRRFELFAHPHPDRVDREVSAAIDVGVRHAPFHRHRRVGQAVPHQPVLQLEGGIRGLLTLVGVSMNRNSR